MTARDLLGLFRDKGLFLEHGHFVYTSGRHGPCYIDSDGILADEDLLDLCGFELARRFRSDGVEAVVGVATGGNRIASSVARHLTIFSKKAVGASMTSKTPDGGIEIVYDDCRDLRGRRTVVVDDVLTTGASVLKAVRSAQRCGADVVAAGVIVHRGGSNAELCGAPRLVELLRLELDSWPEEEAPDWLMERPVDTRFGHGAEYLRRLGRP